MKTITSYKPINCILFSLILLIGMLSCKSENKNVPSEDTLTYDVISILNNAENLIDSTVHLSGTVEHVCSHSGRRCFLIDSTGDKSIKVEAGGEIESFGKELLGTEIIVRGKLKLKKLLESEINEWESELLAEYEDIEKGGEKCASEMENIESMRKWMKERNKDYYAIYFLEGIEYDKIERKEN